MSIKKTQGFTIIEVLIVVLILSTLVTLSIPIMQGAMIKPWISKALLDVDQMRKAIKYYIADDENAAWALDTSLLITKGRPGTDRDAGYDMPDDNINFYYEAFITTTSELGLVGMTVQNVYAVGAIIKETDMPLFYAVIFRNNQEGWVVNENSPWAKYVPLPRSDEEYPLPYDKAIFVNFSNKAKAAAGAVE